MRKILIVEDDPDIVELIKIHLLDLDYHVEATPNGIEGLKKASENPYDLIILDIMLPGKDGISIAQHLRAFRVNTPILMLTAKTEEIDKILGLESGADDYLTKPFSIREFIARVKAIFRRQDSNLRPDPTNTSQPLLFGRLTVDSAKRKVLIDGNRIELTPKEFDLLMLLASHPGRSYSREQLLNEVWGYEFSGYEHTVNSHINRLRAKIENDPNKPQFILTTWGIGYRFNDELKLK